MPASAASEVRGRIRPAFSATHTFSTSSTLFRTVAGSKIGSVQVGSRAESVKVMQCPYDTDVKTTHPLRKVLRKGLQAVDVDDVRWPRLQHPLHAAAGQSNYAGLNTRLDKDLRKLGNMPIQTSARRMRENIGSEQHTH